MEVEREFPRLSSNFILVLAEKAAYLCPTKG
jgi:hypothetical protein